MANTLENTLNKVGNAVEALFNPNIPTTTKTTGQTCLEQYGMAARKEQLMRNEWKKDLQYTKALVNTEYDIQTEFKISSTEEQLELMQSESAENKVGKENKKKLKNIEKNSDENVNKNALEGNVDGDGNEIATGPKETTNYQFSYEKDYWWAKNIPS